MSRKIFLSIVSGIALFIGSFALFFPDYFLQSKGVFPIGEGSQKLAASVWMSEVGIVLLAMSMLMFIVRKEPMSLALKAIFISNIIIQLGLLIIELKAFFDGVITELMGIVPNGILHILLSMGFVYYLRKGDEN